MGKEDISVLLDEKRVFKPKEEFVKQTNVKQWMDKHNIKNLDELYKKAENWKWFWEEISKEFVEWYKPYKKVVEWDAPWVKWFVGAKYNIVHDALDRHVKSWRKNKVAFIFEGEPGDIKKLTYNDLYIEVNKLANALKKLGVANYQLLCLPVRRSVLFILLFFRVLVHWLFAIVLMTVKLKLLLHVMDSGEEVKRFI
jgi:acetyl-CoA synthetase